MFGIKNLLKISVFLIIIILFFSCKPRLIPEEVKESRGYYAYEIGDSLKVYVVKKDSIDIFSLNVNKKENYIEPSYSFYDYEYILLRISNNSNFSINIELWYDDIFNFKIFFDNSEIDLSHLKILNYYNNLEIDGKSYDNVYYLADTLNPYSMYSSKNYGFIKVWNDTITFKFER